MGHHERKQREKENVKKSILQAALKIAGKEGWEAVTIRRIAEAVEYTTSIVYEHFENKDDLLHVLTEHGFAKLNDEFDSLFTDDEKPSDQLLKLSLAHWDFAHKNKAMYQLMFGMKKRPTAESAQRGMDKLKILFERLTGKTDEELRGLILNWVCLRTGCMMFVNFGDRKVTQDEERDPKELYIEFMKRFINSIALPGK